MFNISSAFHSFFDRNIFERIIIYVFLADLLVKIIFELILGQWSFVQSQNKQWFFYGFLALDYLISFRKVAYLRVTVNPMSIFGFILLIMMAHGLFMGISNGNKLFDIFNDTIPLLMIALNIFRMQSTTEYREVDLRFLLHVCIFCCIGTFVFGFAAGALGKPSQASLAGITIFLPLLFACMISMKNCPKWIIIIAFLMLLSTLNDMNRTNMAFLALVMCGYITINTVKQPVKGLTAIVIALLGVTFAWQMVPKDSKTYNRVVGLTSIDLSQSKGSVGERQEEWREIKRKLKSKGETVHMFGLGFGGLYEVARTHFFLTDYGHAHYAWAWFNLRFGKVGYIYMGIMMSLLMYNLLAWSMRGGEQAMFVSLLCVISLLYCMTYVNAVFLMSGIQFMYHRGFRREQTNSRGIPIGANQGQPV